MDPGVKLLKGISNLFRKRLASTYGLAESYSPSINRNKDKLIELIKDKAEIASQSSIAHKLRVLKGYYTLEMAPPTSNQELANYEETAVVFVPRHVNALQNVTACCETLHAVTLQRLEDNHLKKLKSDITLAKEFFKSGCIRYLTVKQAWLLFLVCTEVSLWFYLGETIGKMHIVGYKV